MPPEHDPSLEAGFARDGYVALPGFLTTAQLSELQTRLAHCIAEVVPTLPPHQVFYEDKSDRSTLKQIQRLFDCDPYFRGLMFESPFQALAARLLRAPVVGKNLQYFNKPPGVGQPTPPHQDGFYFKLHPCEAVTLWLALDEVDHENGCVRYLPGSHRGGLRPHQRTQTLGFSQGIPDYPADVQLEKAMIASPGDLLVHHALTIHRADGNRSAHRHRRALGFVYYSSLASEDTAGQDAYQQQLARDWTAAGKI